MSDDERTGPPTFSERTYRALLAAYPRGFRREYGREMARAFADLYEEERQKRGLVGLLSVWARALLDLFTNALAERGGSLMDGSSSGSIRWGGLAAVVGGLLVAAYGLAIPAYGWAFAPAGDGEFAVPTGVDDALALVYLAGSLLVFGGLLGLARLVEGRGELGVPGTGRRGGPGGGGRAPRLGPSGRSARAGRLSWAQRAGAAGLVVAVLAFLALSVLLVDLLAFGGAYVSMAWGIAPPRGPAFAAATHALEVLRILGMPLATMLLGVAVWRSGVLGGWGFLPVALGALSSPLMWALVFAGGYLVAGQDGTVASSTALTNLYFFGAPHSVTGTGWALLGFLLYSGRGGGRREPLPTG